MADSLDTLLGLLSQLTGGRGGIDNVIVNYVVAAIFWSAWLAVAIARYRDDHRPRERLLIWGFSFALSRELFMIGAAVLQALHLVDPVALHAVFPPLEHALHDLGLIIVAAGFIRYLVDRDAPARRYLWAGVGSTVVCYLATFWWWAAFITAHPTAKFGQTWADWVFHINPSLWMLVAAVYLWRNTRGWVRNTICTTLMAFMVSVVLKLPDMALGEVYENIFTPISRLFYLGAALSLGYVFIREQMQERRGYARALEQTMHERQTATEQVQQLLTEAQQSSASLLGILEDQQQAQQALRESEEYMRQIGDNLPGGFIFQVRVETDGRHRLLHISAGVMRINGVSQQEALADIGVLYRQYMDDDWARCAAVLAEAERNFTEYRVEVRMRRPDGEVRWCLQTAAPRRLADGRLLWNGIVLDITEHKRAEILLGGEKIVLELMAKGVPLAEILMVITRNVEAQSNDTLCSILLLDADGIHLRHGAAPSLPEAYNLAVDGEAIGASAGSCGTAVYRKQQVIVTDIETDPLWTDYRELALEHGLRACWSTPILAAGGRILGSFALYHRTPRAPDQADFDIIERLTHLTGIAIERKLAEEAQRHLSNRVSRAQQVAHLGFIDWDLRTNKTYLSDETYSLFGIDPANTLDNDQWITKAVHPGDASLVQKNLQLAAQGIRPYDMDHRIIRPSGEVRWIHAQAELDRDPNGQPLTMLGIVQDITQRKQAETELQGLHEQLKRHAAELEQRVYERTVALEAAKTRAEAADRVKSAFLATMSHELRTPLNSIIGFTGILLQGLTGPLNPEQAKQLGMVRTSSRHLLALINDVLDISKIEAGQMTVVHKPFDLRATVSKVMGQVQPQATEKGLALRVEIAPDIGILLNDQRRVEQVLLNLLNNAIKFTEQGEVALAARVEYAALPVVWLRVSDTGMGIHTEDLPTLFQSFRQLDSGLARNHEGTGLGLAICRRLLDLMGGKIEVESVWGKGSVFTVSLPITGTAQS